MQKESYGERSKKAICEKQNKARNHMVMKNLRGASLEREDVFTRRDALRWLRSCNEKGKHEKLDSQSQPQEWEGGEAIPCS